ncbi:hypothetical protein M758_11G111100 [Ceratodon purpureus]|nr:hypothetical protein M758_11G111100 [Ceratodon purpureus]
MSKILILYSYKQILQILLPPKIWTESSGKSNMPVLHCKDVSSSTPNTADAETQKTKKSLPHLADMAPHSTKPRPIFRTPQLITPGITASFRITRLWEYSRN